MQFVIYLICNIYFLFLKMACLFNACISLNSATYICKSGRWIILAGTNMQEKIIEKHIPRIDTHWVHSNMFNYNFTIPLKHSNLTIKQAFQMSIKNFTKKFDLIESYSLIISNRFFSSCLIELLYDNWNEMQFHNNQFWWMIIDILGMLIEL